MSGITDIPYANNNPNEIAPHSDLAMLSPTTFYQRSLTESPVKIKTTPCPVLTGSHPLDVRRWMQNFSRVFPSFLFSTFSVILSPCEFYQASSLRARCILEIISA